MKMKTALTTAFSLVLALLLGTGCGGGGGAVPPVSGPPPPTAPQACAQTCVYVSDGLRFGTIYAYALPITAMSTPVARVAGLNGPGAMAFDAMHRLFVVMETMNTNPTAGVAVFTQPIADGATAAFTVANPLSGSGAQGIKFDSAGNAYVALRDDYLQKVYNRNFPVYAPYHDELIWALKAPVTGSSTPTSNVCAVCAAPGGSVPIAIALGASGNLWAWTAGTMFEYKPPLSGSSAPALQFALPGSPTDLAFDSAGDMYASSSTGVDVYKPPFAASMTKAFTINTAGTSPFYLAFDAQGKLYVTTASGKLLVFSPPFGGHSVPVVALALPRSSVGVAIGP